MKTFGLMTYCLLHLLLCAMPAYAAASVASHRASAENYAGLAFYFWLAIAGVLHLLLFGAAVFIAKPLRKRHRVALLAPVAAALCVYGILWARVAL